MIFTPVFRQGSVESQRGDGKHQGKKEQDFGAPRGSLKFATGLLGTVCELAIIVRHHWHLRAASGMVARVAALLLPLAKARPMLLRSKASGMGDTRTY